MVGHDAERGAVEVFRWLDAAQGEAIAARGEGLLFHPQVQPLPFGRAHSLPAAEGVLTTLGHPEDFDIPSFRSLLVNAIRWAIDDLD